MEEGLQLAGQEALFSAPKSWKDKHKNELFAFFLPFQKDWHKSRYNVFAIEFKAEWEGAVFQFVPNVMCLTSVYSKFTKGWE